MKEEQIEGVELFECPAKGRGLRVTKPFKVGELLFTSVPYSYVLSVEERGNYCDFCFAKKQRLANCGKCKKAFYCNVNCQKGDWAMHKLECSAMAAFGPKWCPSEYVRLVARILAKKKVQKERCASEKLILVGELQSHEDVEEEKKSINEHDIASLHHFYSKHLDFPDHRELLAMFSQVGCNCFTVEDEELSHNMGTALYPNVSLINHGCVPSVVVTYKGVAAEIRAVQDMRPGDEVLISYIDLLYATEDRNERLLDCYYFTCDCQECKTRSKDSMKLKVRQRSDPIEPDVVSNMVRYAKKIIIDFRKAKEEDEKSPSELLDMCEMYVKKMGTVFEESHVYMLHMYYQAMGVCLYMDDWKGAIYYAEKIIKPYSEMYPPYSLNVSSIYLKLARCYVNIDKPLMATSSLQKAKAIMEVAHGKDHPYLQDIDKDMAKLTLQKTREADRKTQCEIMSRF